MHYHLVSLNSFIFRAIMLRFSVQYRGDFVVILLQLPYATVSIPYYQVSAKRPKIQVFDYSQAKVWRNYQLLPILAKPCQFSAVLHERISNRI